MKASELIVELARIISEQGDLDVFRYTSLDTSERVETITLHGTPEGDLQLPQIVIK